MFQFPARLLGAAVALTIAAATPTFAQQLELKLMAPAAPGGGWDQTARSMQQALVASGVARSVQVINVPGAGGSVGIEQFVEQLRVARQVGRGPARCVQRLRDAVHCLRILRQ